MNSILSLPTLAPEIPLQYTLFGTGAISAPLAIALIELGMITDDDMYYDQQESALVEVALTRWWRECTADLTMFAWQLHVQQLDEYGFGNKPSENPWFCISLAGDFDIPRFSLALRVGELEAELEGLGQTVLAVLEDAFDYLPVAWTLGELLGMASWVYWMGEENEDLVIEEHGEMGEAPPDDLFTRAKFFEHIPEWAARPRRVRSRAELEIAASSDLGKSVIKTCDAISALVNSAGFEPDLYQSKVQDMNCSTIEACAWIRWTEDDVTSRIVDDFINSECQGEYTNFIAAREVEPTASEVKRYLDDTRNMLKLAVLVEQLMGHLGANDNKTLVRVFAEEADAIQPMRIRV